MGQSLDLDELAAGDLKQALGVGGFLVELLLLALEALHRHGFGGVCLEELVELLLDCGQPALVAGGLRAVLGLQGGDVVVNGGLGFGDGGGAELDGAVVALDGLLDVLDGQMRELAALAAAETEEVGVGVALLVAGEVVDHAYAAVAAEDGALEVVVVGAALLAGGAVGAHDLLYAVEGQAVDQGGVFAVVVDDASEGHLAEVVLALEQYVEALGANLAAVVAAQSGRVHLVGERYQAEVAAAVAAECGRHQRGLNGVDLYGREAAAFDVGADVVVAGWWLVGCAAELGLAGHRQAGALGADCVVVLGVGGQHAAQELSGRGAVDVLANRDELHAEFLKLAADDRLVEAVAGEAVDLPDDHVVDVAAELHLSEHPLEHWALGGGLGRLALDVLHDHFGIEAGGLLLAGQALLWDRQSLDTVAAYLARGRDAQVEHGLGGLFDGGLRTHGWLPVGCVH